MKNHFDYIIVGGGSAGCCIARRLSEKSNCTVALLEAGPKDRHPFISIPAAFSEMFKSKLDWQFESMEEKELNHSKMYIPRGKVLGGCSSVNAMIFTRPHQDDFELWNSNLWSWKLCLPYLKKVEKQFGFLHDQDGDAISQYPYHLHSLSSDFILSSQNYGLKQGKTSSSISESAFPFLKNIVKGKRYNAAKAYLHDRPKNLSVFCNTEVRHLLFEQSKCVGVQTEKEKLIATNAVILSSGAIQSPLLLMNSGIGNEHQLKENGIPVRLKNDQVGQNLQDHIICGFGFKCDNTKTLDSLNQPYEKFKALLQYVLKSSGPLTSNIAEAGAFLHLDGNLVPDIELHFAPSFFIQHGFIKPQGFGFSLGPTLLHPKSKGHLHINKHNPNKAQIEMNYLSDPKDMEIMLRGMEIALDIAMQHPLKKHITGIEVPKTIPKSKNEIELLIRQYTQTLYHPVGTCALGSHSDSVVDEKLKVNGVEQLYVVDASVIPQITSSNTQLVTMMIAEYFADLLLPNK